MDNNFFLITFLLFLFIFIIFYLYLSYLENKIKQTEDSIRKLLKERSDVLPSLYEISKVYLIKHDKVFKNLLSLRKIQFTLNEYNASFIEYVKNEIEINHEIRFIFSICLKNKKLNNDKNFEYIKKLIKEKNKKIGENMKKYKNLINKYNSFIKYKNLTIFGIFLNKNKKLEIDLINNIF